MGTMIPRSPKRGRNSTAHLSAVHFSQTFYFLSLVRMTARTYSERRVFSMQVRLILLWLAIAGVGFAQAPSILDGGIVNGASFAQGQPITGGALVSIFGSHLASQLASADTVPLSTHLGGVTVQFVNGNTTLEAPLLFAGPGNPDLINAQVPWNIVPPNTTQTVNVVVNVNGVASAPQPVTVGPFSPGIFAVNGRAVVVNNADGSLAWPAGSFPGLTTHPAKHHDVMIIYATGMGAVDNPPADGANAGSQILSALVDADDFGRRHCRDRAPISFIRSSALSLSAYIRSLFLFRIPRPLGDNVSLQIQMGGVTSPAAYDGDQPIKRPPPTRPRCRG